MTLPEQGPPVRRLPENPLSFDRPRPPLTGIRTPTHAPPQELEGAVRAAEAALLRQQQPEGSWCFELEADCSITAEYILMNHFMGELEPELEAKLAAYLRRQQLEEGGWSLYDNGPTDVSCSVKTYYALKLCGDGADAPHMVRARDSILACGGAARANVFTRITLALFGQIPWRGVPFLPVEIMFLPRWFPFHVSKVSYWSRTVMIPLSILCSLKPRAQNPRQVEISELFTVPPDKERNYFAVRSATNRAFLLLERGARLFEPLIPGAVRGRAMDRAREWVLQRLNGTHGLGGIFPAMVNAYEALSLLDHESGHPYRAQARKAIGNLIVARGDVAYCQPCVSPVWDTALSALALQEAAAGASSEPVVRSLDWLKQRQLVDEPGDWRESHPELPGGGWPFQYGNDHYPDLDDTAAVAWAMHRAQMPGRYREPVQRAAHWLHGMQSREGGFASFDSDNTYGYLNEIPFADHGALLDPPTADVSARCLAIFGRLRSQEHAQGAERCLDFLRREQEPNGSWYGRWGTNYIYGTWSVLAALEEAGEDPSQPYVQRAAAWLKSVQRADGGWGESNDTYFDPATAGSAAQSTAFQTAWALLGLMAAGEAHSESARRGVNFLLRSQESNGLWSDPGFTAPGFPRVFFLKYHGYDKYFPLWALARYRNLLGGVRT